MSNLSRIGVDGYIGKEREFEMFVPEDSGDGSGSPQPTVNAKEIIMADDTVEYVDKNAFGDELDRIPNGYYRSPQFIVLWPTIISTLYTADSIKVGWQSGVIGGGVVLGQAMSGFAIAYVPRLKIQCMCVAALVWLSSRRCVPYPLTGGQIQSHSG
ncbi:major facilitator superfamily transporter [Fusarium globosum]|uniref:Major facilitator superfamily transporter n=1 Tax=Fusarium globosum TaxID=78864 RepID=A0A8H6D3S6_9HYPO|nr:major facilitator superfamily transporter [Fusarium globosum]